MTVKIPETQDMIDTLLPKLGFSDKEVAVYMFLLGKGKATPGMVSKDTGLKRGITYFVLYSLEKRGLVSMYEKGKKTWFQIENPRRLLDMVREQKEEVQTLEHSVKFMLPKLVSQFKIAIDKPTVRYFEGEEGLKEVFEDIYGPKDDIVWGCVDLEKGEDAVPDYIVQKLVPKRIKNKLMAHTFFGDSPAAETLHENDASSYRKSVLVDKVAYPLPAEIDIYEDKIAMLSFEKGEFIGLLIENQAFAETLRSIFKLAHDLSGKRDRK
jgi:sugar-specific transcriptional regulator TrmB